MQITPITEEQAQEASKPAFLLKPGQCDFKVIAARDCEKAKPGQPMVEYIELKMQVWDSNQKEAVVFDYLHPAMPHKVRHAAYATGNGPKYEHGELRAADFLNTGGILQVRTKVDKEYGPKNDVADYLLPDAAKNREGYKTSKAGGPGAMGAQQAKLSAFERFKAKFPSEEPGYHKREFRKLCEGYFQTADFKDVTGPQWQRLVREKLSDPVTNPIGEAQVFGEDDIPF